MKRSYDYFLYITDYYTYLGYNTHNIFGSCIILADDYVDIVSSIPGFGFNSCEKGKKYLMPDTPKNGWKHENSLLRDSNKGLNLEFPECYQVQQKHPR